MSSDVPTADASHLTGSVIMTTIVETILMSKDVVCVKVILRLLTDLLAVCVVWIERTMVKSRWG